MPGEASEYFPESGDLTEADIETLIAEFGLGFAHHTAPQPFLD